MISYERALDCEPENIDTRFSAAFIYATFAPLKLLAVRHYRIILKQNPNHSSTLNNLSLLFGDLGLPGQKVELLKKASRQNDAHAIGNLASLYIKNGLLDEAEEALSKASAVAGSADRLLSARRELANSMNQGEQKLDALISEAEKLSKYFADFAIVDRFLAEDVFGTWAAADGKSQLDIGKQSHFYSMVWTQGSNKLYGFPLDLSAICTIGISKDPTPPRNMLL